MIVQPEKIIIYAIPAVIFILAAIGTGFGREIGTHIANWFISSSKKKSTDNTGDDSNIFIVGEDVEIETSGEYIEIKQLDESVSGNRAVSLADSPKLFVEGHSDREIIKIALDYFCNQKSREMYPCNINIIDVGGAANINKSVEWGSSKGKDYCVLLDADMHHLERTPSLKHKVDDGSLIFMDYVDSEAGTLFDLLPERFQVQPGDEGKSIKKFQQELKQGTIADSELTSLKRLLWRITDCLHG